MCQNPAKVCPQDNNIVTGTVPTMCFPKGAKGGGYEFKSIDDLANPTIMRNVFGAVQGTNDVCSDMRYSLGPLPTSSQEARKQGKVCKTTANTEGWVLPVGCIGNNPSGGLDVQAKCCAGLLFPSVCPQGFCPNSDQCVNVMSSWCKTNGPDSVCTSYFQNSLNDSAKKDVVNNVIQNISQSCGLRTCPSSYYNMCKLGPAGSCDDFLNNACKNYDRADLNASGTLTQVCGCHLPPSEYNKYAHLQTPVGMIQRQCDPLCGDTTVIQQGNNCKPNRCTQTVCIMDFSNKNIQNMVQNGVNLDQNCYGTPGQGNTCIFSLTIDDAKNVIEKNINVSQKCGGCQIYDPSTGNLGNLDCGDLNGSIKNYFGLSGGGTSTLGIIIGVIAVVIALFVILKKWF